MPDSDFTQPKDREMIAAINGLAKSVDRLTSALKEANVLPKVSQDPSAREGDTTPCGRVS